MVAAGASLVGLGLVMGFSPSMYAVVLHLLTTENRPARLIRWLTLGIVLGATILMFAFRAVDPDVLARLLEDRTRELLVRRGVDLAAGLVFLLLAAWQWHRSRRPLKPHRPPSPGDARPSRMVLIGLANTFIGFSGPATMYVAGRAIRGAGHHHLWVEVLLYLVFLLGVAGPYLLAAWAWGAFPRAARAVRAGSAWAARQDIRPAVAILLAAAGVVFLVLAAVG
ncbi:GAP family protein [Rothia kristinae]|uniref:GAP family protein n=1 Tax=Rothia kristinae TaxID=37923 RepID=UPI0007730CC4|nr:GAP family protein [Rothia kristinae]